MDEGVEIAHHRRVWTTEIFTTADAQVDVLSQIRRLLHRAFQGELSDEDWEHALGGWHVVAMDGRNVVAHAAAVARTLEIDAHPFAAGYVEGVATAPERQGVGLGTSVMRTITEIIRAEFELGALSTSRPDFYERLGWERWRGPTFVRHGADLMRTEAEDDGVMVLRFGPSSEVDLTTAISCDARSGDPW